MSLLFLLPAVMAAGADSDDSVRISATIPVAVLEVGKEYEFVLNVELGEGGSASSAGIPSPLLQILVPPSVELVGKVLETRKELRQNEFLQAPFERALSELPAKIPFKLVKQPTGEDVFYLNVLAYVTPSPDAPATFLRRRLALPVSANATASEVNPVPSDWGVGKELQIGDQAGGFKLPSAAGGKVSLKSFRGKKNVVVSTYRAHW